MKISYLSALAVTAALTLAFIETLPFAQSSAWAANFSSINGSWRGSGQLKLQDGKTEQLRCRAYYNPKDGGNKLGMAVRCASTSYKFEFRSQLALDGTAITGSWEERNFNAEGNVEGTFKQGDISLAATGAVEADMSVQYTASTQTVRMNGEFGNFRGIELSFKK